jgi:hypothetical protein
MLLARKGYRVLLLDKATFPSFVSVQAATLPASEFFELGNVGRIMGEAGTAG